MGLDKKLMLSGSLTKTEINPVSVFRVFDLLYIQLKPYESKLSTALSERKAVARCATRKTDTAINRIKTVGGLRTGHREIHTVMDIETFVALQLWTLLGRQMHR